LVMVPAFHSFRLGMRTNNNSSEFSICCASIPAFES
jgi:hypothetical protein